MTTILTLTAHAKIQTSPHVVVPNNLPFHLRHQHRLPLLLQHKSSLVRPDPRYRSQRDPPRTHGYHEGDLQHPVVDGGDIGVYRRVYMAGADDE